MANNDERHFLDNRNDTRERNTREPEKKTNWWPLLLLPVAFALGWGVGDRLDNNNQQTAETSRTEYGIGGGPGDIPSPSPSPSPIMDNIEMIEEAE
jgi:hypothetical protein